MMTLELKDTRLANDQKSKALNRMYFGIRAQRKSQQTPDVF